VFDPHEIEDTVGDCLPGDTKLPVAGQGILFKPCAASPGGGKVNPMKLESLPYYIRSHRQDDLVVEFDDGDRYPVWALDMSGENPDGKYEISVWFKDCIGDSQAQTHALEAGTQKNSPPGTWWSSETPKRPVGMLYTTRRIKSIYDNAAGYRVYERESAE
jgi:hypothetical protein